MNRFVNFDNCEKISCSCIDCDDWDVVKVDFCDFCQPEKKIYSEMNRLVQFQNSEILRCSCIDCDDCDVVKVDHCEFCQLENVKKRAEALNKLKEQNRKFEAKRKTSQI